MAGMQTQAALFELTELDAQARSRTFDQEAVRLLGLAVPPEFVTRLQEVWDRTKIVAGEVIAIGRIVVMKIVDFVVANPGLTIGLAVGAAVAVLVAPIPFLGAILAPVIVVLGALYGINVQDGARDSLLVSAHRLAQKFFGLLLSIFEAVRDRVQN